MSLKPEEEEESPLFSSRDETAIAFPPPTLTVSRFWYDTSLPLRRRRNLYFPPPATLLPLFRCF